MARRRARLVPLVQLLRRTYPGTDVEALIAERRLRVDGVVVTNLRSRVPVDGAVHVVPPPGLRGTAKLASALARFDISVDGRVAVDVGAAAGGFTTALLEAGARRVYAVDVGHGQLVGRLRQERRVVNFEGTNLAALDEVLVPEPVGVLTGDLSYLPAGRAIGQLGRLRYTDDAELVWLVKPTFELGLAAPPTGAAVLRAAVTAAATAITAAGWRVVDSAESPVRGRRGTSEFFLHGRRGGGR